ncbi:hypothetical protein [Sphingosinicella sp.]|uniref:hypothetical protein n=1 Tax=Sphingosinicella sp. TaxID=1917971 RepID=UPI004037E861
MRGLVAPALLLVASCGLIDDATVNSEQLERIAIQRNQAEDIGATARLEPLGPISPPPGYRNIACRFTRGGELLVLAGVYGAAAQIDGRLRIFQTQGPLGPTGGFFRDQELALSIGVEAGAPARARVSNRSTGAQQDHEGEWQCAQVTG